MAGEREREIDPAAPTRTLPTPRAPEGPRAGDRVGRYVVERTLGQGGMGVVVEARDPELQRQVALKLVRPEIGDEAYRLRLVREARAMAKLEHANVVRVYDAGEVDGEVFVAMELVVGRSLGAWLRAVRRPWREVLARFVDAGRGLAAAHAAGMVHRDFKPDNVLVRDSDGRACVTDFGLAVPADREARPGAAAPATVETTPISGEEATIPTPSGSTFTLTRTGVAVGTPPYMAPEQHVGGAVDARADIFSFCASLYEGVYGERPFVVDSERKHDPDAWAAAIARGVRPAPAGRRVPAALRRALVRGLASDPADRWPSMQPLLAALTRVLARRRRVAIAAIAAAIVAAFGAVVVVARRAPIDRCATEAASASRAWGPRSRAQVTHALLASGQVYAPTALRNVTSELDEWTSEWHDLRESACHDFERGALQLPTWRTIATCLDSRLRNLDRRVELLTSDRNAVNRAATIADLESPSECLHLGTGPMPTDPARLALVFRARAELVEADALTTANRFNEAEPHARRALTIARALGWRPLIDDAAFALVLILHGRRIYIGEGDALSREVVASAATRGADGLAVLALDEQLETAAQTGRLDGLDYLASAARAAAARAHSSQLFTEAEIGIALIHAGRVDEASATCEAALARSSGSSPGEIRSRLRLLRCLALAAEGSAQPEKHLAYSERLMAEEIGYAGARHAIVVDTLGEIATSMFQLGRIRDALVVHLTEQAWVEQVKGPESEWATHLWAQIAQCWVALDEPARARAALARATDLARRVPLGEPVRLEVLRERANVLRQLHDPQGAIDALQEAVEHLRRERPGSLDEVATTLYYAQSLQAEHRCPEALPALDEVIQHAANLAAGYRILLEEQRADCLLDMNRPAEAARGLADAVSNADLSGVDHHTRGVVLDVLADAYDRTGNASAALGYALRARDEYKQDQGSAGDITRLDKLIARIRHHAGSSPQR